MKRTELALAIVVAILSGIASGIGSGYVTSMLNKESLKSQINFLEEEINVQKDELEDSKVKTAIMDQQLQTMKKSLEKKSSVSVKVNAHAPGGPYEAMVTYESSINGTKRTLETLESRIVLTKNEITQFDIIITNIGNDVAIINGIGSAEIIVNEGKFQANAWVSNIHPNGTVLDHSIGKILKPNSDSLIVPFWINATSDFAPKGEIFFTVIHDNGINSTASINYKFAK